MSSHHGQVPPNTSIAPAPRSAARRGFPSVLSNRHFARVLVSDAFSGTGDVLYWVALIVLLLGRDSGGSLVAAAVVVRLVPRVAFGAFGGVVADRYDRRCLLMFLDGSRALLMFALAAVAAMNGPSAVVLGLVFVTCALSTPYRPAVSSGYPLLLPERDLAAANAMSSTVGQVSALSGPLLGALLLTVGAPSWSFVANGCTYVLSVVLMAKVRGLGCGGGRTAAAGESTSWFGQLAIGMRSVQSQPGVAGLLMLIASVMLLRGFELVLHVQAAEKILHLGPSGYGLISAALGAGALVTAPFTSRLAGSLSPGHVVVTSALVGCAPLVLLSVSNSTELGMLMFAVQGASIVSFEVVALTMLQRACRSDVLGRVLGMQNTFSGSAKLVGSLLAPVLVVGVGLRSTLFAAAALSAVLASMLAPRILVAGRASRAVRDRLEPFVAVLSRLDIFEAASRPAIERIAMTIQREKLDAGTTVVREGDDADDFFIIERGDFVVRSRGVEINTLGADDWFGEIGLLRRTPRTATVESTSSAELWRIPGDVFLGAVTSSSALSDSLVETMATRLERSDAVQPSGSAPDPDADGVGIGGR